MINESNHIDELIANYLSGEATPDEVQLVERWKDESEENRIYFDHFRLIFEKSASLRDTITVDTDEAWNNVKRKLEGARTVSINRSEQRFSFLRIAASIALFIAVGVFAYRFMVDSSVEQIEVVADNTMRSDTLPDGSQVFLNKQTRIEYSFNRRQDTHTAKLSGEAYFDIEHRDDRKFVVEAGETLIRDIGTSFNVSAYPESGSIEVVVDEGEVLFYTKDNPGVQLKAGDRGVYDRARGQFTVASREPNATAYKTKSFVFDGDALKEVISTLNAVYDRPMRIDDGLEDCKLTVSFNEEDIEEIAHVIAETLNLSVEQKADTLWLRGNGCGEAPIK